MKMTVGRGGRWKLPLMTSWRKKAACLTLPVAFICLQLGCPRHFFPMMLSYRCQYPSKEAITVKGGNKSDVILRIVAFYTRCLSCQFGYKAECYLRLEVRAFLTAQLPRRQDRYEATNKLCRGRANADNPSCLIPGLSVSLGNGEDRYRHRRTRCLRGAGRAAQPTPPVVPSMQTSRPTDRPPDCSRRSGGGERQGGYLRMDTF